MTKNVSPFNGDYNLAYHRIGREQKPKKSRDLENLRFGKSTQDQTEIDICLSCDLPKCRPAACKRLHRLKSEAEGQGGK